MTILAINIPVILESLIIGILGSSIVALAVEQWKKRKKSYHVSLTLNSSEIYAPRRKSDVSITVDYKGKPVDNALVIMRVSLTNDGQNDIMFDSHFSEAIIIQSNGYRFLSIAADDDRTKPVCELIDDGTATLSWEILKRGESIKLCIAAQSEQAASRVIDRVDCYNNLLFDFRSDCIDAIEPFREMTFQDEHRRLSLNSSILKYACMICISLMFLFFDMSFASRYDITYEGKAYKNSTLLYTPLLRKYILGSDSAAATVLSKEDIGNINSVKPSDANNLANKLSALLEMLILVILISSIGFISYNSILYSRYKKSGRMQNKKTKRK